MNKTNVRHLLYETFKNDFDEVRFAKFIKEVFNDFTFVKKNVYVWNEYNDYIENCYLIGNYIDKSENTIAILTVKLKKNSSRDRARTMQRNFIAKYLGNYNKDAALIAFFGDDEDWRFSFVKMEYYRSIDEEGNVRVEKALTPAKRYSYLVGRNEPNHTCESQFAEVLMKEGENPSLNDIEEAFSVENVTKEFFSEYRELFLDLNDELMKILCRDNWLKEEFEEKGISTIAFSKKLLGQIIFIYFLQKKGWLGVKKNCEGRFEQWGTGPKNFLRRLFDKDIVPYENFFNDILEPLFYEALATGDRDDDYYSRFKCKIPFLNGGLFEPINDYDWAGTEINLGNKVFDKIFSTFDRYNFTVKEDEPLDKEVAVDPEMLGKVFENLLEVNDRKSKGAFYTPREIVHYMCQESLINYLETKTTIKREDIAKFIQLGDLSLSEIIKEQEHAKKYGKTLQIVEQLSIPTSIKENFRTIDALLQEIKIVDPAVGSGAFPVGMMNEIVKARSILSIMCNQEEQLDRTNYKLKRETIEKCLYGVDIEPSAVEITKLRFWLSLIVDEQDKENVRPLPNLDYKIMCGNSLLEEFEGVKLFDESLLDQIKEQYPLEIKMIDQQITSLRAEKGQIALGIRTSSKAEIVEKEIKKLIKKRDQLQKSTKRLLTSLTLDESLNKRVRESGKKFSALKALHKQYFDSENKSTKKKLREHIEQMEWEFIEETMVEQGNQKTIRELKKLRKNRAKPFFLWKLYFAEVFQRENPGFDVVIANPPYIEFKKMDASQKNNYKRNFYSANGKYDLYVLFIELSKKLLTKNGCMTFINPTMFLKRDYGAGIRTFIKENFEIVKIIDFAGTQIFESATNYTGIFIFRNSKQKLKCFTLKKFKNMGRPINKNDFADCLYKESYSELCESLSLDSKILGDPIWNFSNLETSKVLKKIEFDSVKLSEVSEKIFQGISSGKDEIFYLNKEQIQENHIEKEIVFPLLKGQDIKRYKINWGGFYVLYPYDENSKVFNEKHLATNFRNAYEYLLRKKQKLSNRDYFNNSTKKWYELWNQRKFKDFIDMRIVVPEISKRNNFMICDKYFGNTKTYHILLKDRRIENYLYVLAILNSTILQFYYIQSTVPKAGGFYAYKTQFLKLVPIKLASRKDEKYITERVKRILLLKSSSMSEDRKNSILEELEKEINHKAYEIYKLTEDDILFIESQL